MRVLHCSILALCIAASAAAFSAERSALPDPKAAIARPDLAKALRAGNLTLYFRHAATDFSQSDRDDSELADCAKQRNLTDQGRREARAIGEAMRVMNLPVGEVLASPYCRTLETGRLIAGRATKSADVRGHMATTGRPDYAALEKILATPPAAGTLRIVASHGNPFFAIAGEPRLDEGEAAVIRGDGRRWTIVARIKVGEWAALARPTP
jgi:phosphohistidine phosphatase SixA